MAGMPPSILERAGKLLTQLEQSHSGNELAQNNGRKTKKKIEDKYQLSFIQLDDPLLDQIKQDILNTDINTLTPV